MRIGRRPPKDKVAEVSSEKKEPWVPLKAAKKPDLLVVKSIPLKKILVKHETNVRIKIYDTDVSALAGSQKRVGQINPIMVRPLMDATRSKPVLGPNGEEYELIAGEQRYRARWLETDGEGEINATIREMDDRTADAINFDENIFRYNLNLYEIMQRCLRRREKWGESAPEMSASTEIAERELRRFFAVADRVAPDLIDKFRIDARVEILDRLDQASRIEGVNAADRHALQRRWWENEGWTAAARAKRDTARSNRRKIAQTRRAADMIEITTTIIGPDGPITLSEQAARAVASALRWTIEPADHPQPYKDFA